MAIDVAPDFDDLNLCDTDNWSSGDLITIGQIQGTGCMSDAVSATTGSLYTYTITSTDMTDGGHVFVWMSCGGVVDTIANGGYRIHLASSGGSKLWYVGGNNTHPSGWNCFVLDPQNTDEYSETGTFDASAVTQIGIQFKTLTSTRTIGREVVPNVYWDAFRYGGVLTITSGTTDGIGIADVYAEDDTDKWGVVQYKNGVYFVTGTLLFGDASGTNSVDYDDIGQSIVFASSSFIADDFNNISIVGNGTGTTNFVMGDKVGGQGISGCNLISEDNANGLTFTATDTDIDILTLYGCSFKKAAGVSLPTTATTKEVVNCSFEQSGQVSPGTTVLDSCFFINTSDTDAALLWNESINISSCSFIGNTTGAGIEMPSNAGTPYAYDELMFYGNTYDVLNSSGSAIDVNKNNDSNPSTYEGSAVTFLGPTVDTEITIKDISTGLAIENANVLVWVADDTNFPYLDSVTISGSGTTATVTHTAHGLATGDNVIISGANEDPYNGAFAITYVSDNSYTYTMAATPATPATGTITSTFAIINELSSALGIADDTRIVDTDQPIVGYARKSSSSPYYQEGAIVGTIDNVTGLSLTIQLVSDE